MEVIGGTLTRQTRPFAWLFSLVFLVGCVSSTGPSPNDAIDPQVSYQRAVVAIEVDDWTTAIDELEPLRERFPSDLVIRSWLLICWQNVGDLARRDLDHQALVEIWQSLDSEERDPLFTRDYFRTSGKRVEALEYFELEGERALKYVFYVTDPANGEETRLSLGSYELTTLFMRQRGEIGQDERAFHLDEYGVNSHLTWAFFHGEPSYDEVRNLVEEILAGKHEPLSSSRSREP